MKPSNRRVFLQLLSAGCILPAQTLVAAEVPAPADGQGMLVLYRPRKALGAALQLPTSVDGTIIGNMTNGQIVAQPVAPGQHVVETSSASVAGRASVSVNVAAGETAYVKVESLWGYPAGRPGLSIMSAAQGANDVGRM